MKTKETIKPIQIVSGFADVASEISRKYYPDVKYYHDNPKTQKIHYSVELFNNGCLGYGTLIKRISKACKDSPENIHSIVSKYIKDFGDYEFKP